MSTKKSTKKPNSPENPTTAPTAQEQNSRAEEQPQYVMEKFPKLNTYPGQWDLSSILKR